MSETPPSGSSPVTAGLPFPWSLLDLAPTSDSKAIRSAYARAIKAMDLDQDVEGYARLRDARDTALRLAKQGMVSERPEASPSTPAPTPDPAPTSGDSAKTALQSGDDVIAASAGRLSLTPPVLFAGVSDTSLSVLSVGIPLFVGDEETIWLPLLSALFTSAGTQGDSVALLASAPSRLSGHVLPQSPVTGQPRAEPTPAQLLQTQPSLQMPFAHLVALLVPEDGPNPDDPPHNRPLNRFQENHARALLQAIVQSAHQADIRETNQIEEWVAALFLKTWPRSRTLLEMATDSFGWEREWGQLGARPNIELLGAKLRAWRFEQELDNPRHPLHKAWLELQKSGRPARLLSAPVRRANVLTLLSLIRKHHPDLDSRLNPQRVIAWQQDNTSLWPTIMLIVLILTMVLAVFSWSTQPAPRAPATPIETTPDTTLSDTSAIV